MVFKMFLCLRFNYLLGTSKMLALAEKSLSSKATYSPNVSVRWCERPARTRKENPFSKIKKFVNEIWFSKFFYD